MVDYFRSGSVLIQPEIFSRSDFIIFCCFEAYFIDGFSFNNLDNHLAYRLKSIFAKKFGSSFFILYKEKDVIFIQYLFCQGMSQMYNYMSSLPDGNGTSARQTLIEQKRRFWAYYESLVNVLRICPQMEAPLQLLSLWAHNPLRFAKNWQVFLANSNTHTHTQANTLFTLWKQ